MGSLITEHPSPARPPGALQGPPPPDRAGDGRPRQVDTDRDSLDERVTDLVVESGSGFELFAALIAIALAVLGLVGYHPSVMASGATLAVGFALLAQGGAITSRWRRAVHRARTERTEQIGLSSEMFGGFALIVLGVLALIDVAPVTLLAVAALVGGAALLLGGPTQPDFSPVEPGTSPVHWQVRRTPARAPAGAMILAGLAALVLGLSALLGWGPSVTLVLVAMLATAAALLLAGATVVNRFVHRFV